MVIRVYMAIVRKFVNQDLTRILGNIFFSNQVTDRWNSLDEDTVDAPSLNCFKNRRNKIRCTRTGFFMDGPLNPRPCHVGWPQDKAPQGKHPRSSVPLHLSPVKCPSWSFALLVKAHTKLLILHIRIWQRATEMEITVRHGYAATIGSLVWALNKRESDREGAFDWGHLTRSKWSNFGMA